MSESVVLGAYQDQREREVIEAWHTKRHAILHQPTSRFHVGQRNVFPMIGCFDFLCIVILFIRHWSNTGIVESAAELHVLLVFFAHLLILLAVNACITLRVGQKNVDVTSAL